VDKTGIVITAEYKTRVHICTCNT